MLRMMMRTTMNCWDTPGEWKAERLSQQWNDLKSILEKACDWWNPFLRHTWKELRITPGELEESGKILGKDLWVRAHWRDNTVEKDDETDRWNTGTIEIFEWGDNLELIQTQPNLLRCLEHSGRINWQEANEQGKHLIQGKEYDQPEKLELSPPEKKKWWRMSNGTRIHRLK